MPGNSAKRRSASKHVFRQACRQTKSSQVFQIEIRVNYFFFSPAAPEPI
jgi:hypothetical protein